MLSTSFVLMLTLLAAGQTSKPNIIIILTDDAGYADFGFQSHKLIPTPNIDALQSNGITFSQAYVTAPNCSPSRAGLLTGRYQQRYGHEYNLYNSKPLNGVSSDSLGLPLPQKIMPQYLKALGYTSAAIGKWHLGSKDYYHPMQRGFDYFFGTLEGSSFYKTGQAKEIIRGYQQVPADSLPYLTDAFGDEAVKFIAGQQGPFFLYLAFNAPHVPLQAKKEYLDFYRQQFHTIERATNAAMTRSIDDNVGKLIRELREKGIYENTLIVFSNDNGGPVAMNGGNASNNSPLRGAKVMLYEGGIRVPMIFHWPAMIRGKQVSQQVVSTLDWLPTFMDIADAKPTGHTLDGISLLPTIKGRGQSDDRTLFWRQGNVGAVRSGNWKLIVFENSGRPPELYHLSTDIGEDKNLVTVDKKKAHNLQRLYEAWEKGLARPLWTGGPSDEQVIRMYDQQFVPRD